MVDTSIWSDGVATPEDIGDIKLAVEMGMLGTGVGSLL